jgi:quercetin dioxygenase-like cupin family protein
VTEPTSLCELASFYALGLVGDDELNEYEGHLLDGCPRCEAELKAAEGVAPLLAYSVDPAAPPPRLRAALLDEIATRARIGVDRPGSAGEWVTSRIPGVRTRTLQIDAEKRRIVMLVKAAPGFRYPAHQHDDLEELVMLDGELVFGGVTTYRAGDFIRSEAGTSHPPSETASGCVFLMSTSLDAIERARL